VDGKRYLLVTADDYGIGPATSQGILELAARGVVTSSVLLVTSPYAEKAVQAWRQAGKPLELGWHPCLTLDRPLSAPNQVSSLLDSDGCFWSLGGFLRRLWTGRIRPEDIELELRAQYGRFRDLLGQAPTVVNFHHHVQIFPPVGAILQRILAERPPLPYLRRIREPWQSLLRVPGARGKRAFLSFLGRRDARNQEQAGFQGNDWLAGVTDPPCVVEPRFLVRWLSRMPGRVVELTCHPGHRDPSLIGRDCVGDDAQFQRRSHELNLLQQASFREAYLKAGFQLVAPAAFLQIQNGAAAHAA
jgi:predicted glycoside hydrolase/deacetylase ChbG (UPF0249 family)